VSLWAPFRQKKLRLSEPLGPPAPQGASGLREPLASVSLWAPTEIAMLRLSEPLASVSLWAPTEIAMLRLREPLGPPAPQRASGLSEPLGPHYDSDAAPQRASGLSEPLGPNLIAMLRLSEPLASVSLWAPL
jgi:hypothetical protein